MASFKVKLVVYFLLLSLLPLAAAFWGFSTVAARSETRRVDARLQAGLRAALATYQDELVVPTPRPESSPGTRRSSVRFSRATGRRCSGCSRAART